MNNNNAYLASKPRYEILDGLRGVAAMLVVMFHLFETYSKGTPYQIINHGYLAVDFFFVLSGFVIGYAYDDRWEKPRPQTHWPPTVSPQKGEGGKLTLWAFLKRRLIRLHPMLVMGTLIGLLFFYFGGDHPDFAAVNETPAWLAIAVTLLCLTMFPAPTSLDIRGWGEMNPLNGATWSLFWEYLANVAYALVIRRLSKVALAVCVAVFAVLTVILCLNIDVFGWLAARDYAQYTVIGGWSLTPDQLQIGLTRLLYPFFCGLLISRLFSTFNVQSSIFNIKGGFWWCSLAIVVLFAMPRVGGDNPANYWMNGTYEALCILLLFPLIVSVGAVCSTKGRTTAINRFLGDISYPLYVTHYPLIYWQMSWATTHKDLPASVHVLVAVCIFVLAVGIAYASLKLYDLPVREWLKRKLFQPAAR